MITICGLFALESSSSAQVDHAQIKNKPDAPLQITEAHCGQDAQGSYCSAALEFADTKKTWDGYGILWTLTFENGSKATGRQGTDRSIEPTGDRSGSYKPSGRFYKPREIVDVGAGKAVSALLCFLPTRLRFELLRYP